MVCQLFDGYIRFQVYLFTRGCEFFQIVGSLDFQWLSSRCHQTKKSARARRCKRAWRKRTCARTCFQWHTKDIAGGQAATLMVSPDFISQNESSFDSEEGLRVAEIQVLSTVFGVGSHNWGWTLYIIVPLGSIIVSIMMALFKGVRQIKGHEFRNQMPFMAVGRKRG